MKVAYWIPEITVNWLGKQDFPSVSVMIGVWFWHPTKRGWTTGSTVTILVGWLRGRPYVDVLRKRGIEGESEFPELHPDS